MIYLSTLAAILVAQMHFGAGQPKTVAFFKYTNERFGFSILIPGTLTNKSLPENGDGCEFSSPDGRVRLNVAAGNHVLAIGEHKTLFEWTKEAHTMTLDSLREKGIVPAYARMKTGLSVISWADHGYIHYSRAIIYPTVETEFDFVYPKGLSRIYDPMVTRIAASLVPAKVMG